LQHAPLAGPELLKLEDQILERLHEIDFPAEPRGRCPYEKIERRSVSASDSSFSRGGGSCQDNRASVCWITS
jgi:hypothetical protein